MNKLFKSLLLVGLTWASLGLAGKVLAAGSFSLVPATGTGSEFTVQLVVDTGGESTIESDAVLHYDPAILQVTSVTFGDLYPENIKNEDPANGMLSMYSFFSGSNPTDVFQGSGVLATIRFTGLVSGSSDVTIDCTKGSTSDSNIISSTTGGDILECQRIENGVYTVAGAGLTGSITPTPTIVLEVSATPTVVPTLTPTPTTVVTPVVSVTLSPSPTQVQELLASGSMTPTLTISMVGIFLLIISLMLFIW